MWTQWVSREWRDEGFSDFAYEIRATGRTTTSDGVELVEVGGHYRKADDYYPTRKAALHANYEDLKQRHITLQRQCEALLQEIAKEGDA